jgi:hypothetical protein
VVSRASTTSSTGTCRWLCPSTRCSTSDRSSSR